MPDTIAALAQPLADLISREDQPSRGSTARLIAAAANPAGHRNIGQVSPTRNVNDFQKKYPKGTMTQVESRMATASRRRYPRHAVSATPERTTGSRIKPTSPNCRPTNSPTVRNDNSCVAVARTDWNRNDAQSCPAFQSSTGRNNATAISAATQGMGLVIQRPRQSGTNMNASTAGSHITIVNFDNKARPANMPAASHQRASPLSLSRTSAHHIATANGIRATSGATLAISRP